ncbi:hypothetical protein SDC9_80714 [bioreactor metagenome]|uniref:Uncharacterized protein n=1 Tax=bioreactor metagenome TaxID=1076179 RepID=A0A644Z068_9ZZZZ
MVVVLTIIVVVDRASSIVGGFGQFVLVLPHPIRVGVVVHAAAEIPIHSHCAVAMEMIGVHLAAVDGNLVVVHPQAVALGITIGEEPALQHAVRRIAYAGNTVCRVEGCLLDILEVVVRVPVELQHPYFMKRILTVVPDLGQVERIVRMLCSLLFGHNLYIHGPSGEVTFLNGFKQIPLMAFPVIGNDCRSFCIGQEFNALLGLECEFDPHPLIFCIDE